MTEKRPDPQQLLERAQQEAKQEQRGKFKIYLGAAPGVGKTYTMLQDALEKRVQGFDVVIGIIESHGRKEVEALVEKFEIVPRQAIDYRGKQVLELDLDAILKRNPGLILIDEMAHTNIAGMRHTKRWQDIKELLDRGIDIYTTLNVQHIESLNDIVAKIIQTHIKETVPDFMIESADTVELVDLPPEDLLKRLREGKVYFPAQIELAQENFFRKDNLIALRDLALRVTAELIETQVLLYRQGQDVKRILLSREKILVCIGSGRESIKLIRTAKRIATNLQAEWIAVHVDSPRFNLSDEERNKASQYLHFAETLGAETRILTGFDIVKEIMNFSYEQNITLIIIWKQIRSRFRDFFFRRLADEIVRHSSQINVYIVTPKVTDKVVNDKPKKFALFETTYSWRNIGIALGIVAIATIVNLILYPFFASSNLIMVYLLAVIVIALFGEIIPSITASIVCVLAYDFFFIPPFSSFAVSDSQYFSTLIIMLFIALLMSYLMVLVRRQANSALFVERHTAALHNLSRQLASIRGSDKILKIAVEYIGEIFNSHAIVLMLENNVLAIKASYGDEQLLSEKEQGVAQWVFDLGQVAGLGTDTLSFSKALYIPLLAPEKNIGVLRIKPIQANYLFTAEQMRLLEFCTNQITLALEADRLEQQAKKIAVQQETDRIHGFLLTCISYDLHTPLTAALIQVNKILQADEKCEITLIKKTVKEINFQLEQLKFLLNNFIQMAYFETNTIKLKKEWCSLKEIIDDAITRLNIQRIEKAIQIHIIDDLPKIWLDKMLMQEMFFNLIDSTIKSTVSTVPIAINVTIENNELNVIVLDYDSDLYQDTSRNLFDKSHSSRKISNKIVKQGMGLGLAVCQKIIVAHNGKVLAVNYKESGVVFHFTLPMG